MKYLKGIILVLFLSLGSSSLAAQGSVVDTLMNDAASMLDLGLYRIKQDIYRKILKDDPEGVVSVTYDSDEKMIYVEVMSSRYDAINIKQAKMLCEKTLIDIKVLLGIAPETGKPEILTNSDLEFYFTHYGNKNKSLPENFGKELDKITMLSASIFIKSEKINIKSCESPLLGTKILFSE